MRTAAPPWRVSAGRCSLFVAVLFATLLSRGHASACALEGDDVVLKRVVVGYTYPDSLDVLGAVSRATLAGKLDRMPTLGAALTPAGRQAEIGRISRLLSKLGLRLARHAPADMPALSIVLLEPMLWSRIAIEKGKPRLSIHVGGPTEGDVVAVTEAPVVAALAENTLSAREAVSLGLIRLYGSAPRLEAARLCLGAGDSHARLRFKQPKS
jgi:hypothetical protein